MKKLVLIIFIVISTMTMCNEYIDIIKVSYDKESSINGMLLSKDGISRLYMNNNVRIISPSFDFKKDDQDTINGYRIYKIDHQTLWSSERFIIYNTSKTPKSYDESVDIALEIINNTNRKLLKNNY